MARGESGGRGDEGVRDVEIMGAAVAAADLGTAEVPSHDGRLTRSIPASSLEVLTVVLGVSSASFSRSLSLSSSRWLFHTAPRPIEVTPQLLPTLAAR